jgi:hypothetical protein
MPTAPSAAPATDDRAPAPHLWFGRRHPSAPSSRIAWVLCWIGVAAAMVAAGLEAALDAASVMARVFDGAPTGRTLWLFAFFVSSATVVGGLLWLSGRGRPLAGTPTIAVVGCLNLSVALVYALRPGSGAALGALHLVLGVLFVAVALVASPRTVATSSTLR